MPRVCIIGAGLAGLATASGLAGRGFEIQLLEARDRTGGRAGSFIDASTGQMLDACQHVSMGCCTNLAHFCKVVGIDHLLEPQPRLFFMTPDRRVSPFGPDPVPAPFHLTRSFLGAHYLTLDDRLRIASGLASLRLTSPDDDRPFSDWLRQTRQTQRTVERFWGLILVSALNEEPDRIGLKYARKVMVDGFLRHRQGCVVEVPRVPLGQLYGQELSGWMARQGIQLHLAQAVRRVLLRDAKVKAVELRNGAMVEADAFVITVPFDRVAGLLPDELAPVPVFAGLQHLQPSPITSVHLWYRQAVTTYPHLVLIGCVGQWVFPRGETTPGEHYVQVVVSASRALRTLGHEEIQRRIVAEMESLFPVTHGNLLRGRVVTEQTATFSAVPGVDRWRPRQTTPVTNLFLAGDWTATGWPATMEGAVRSGYLAAEGILAWQGQRLQLVQPDLG